MAPKTDPAVKEIKAQFAALKRRKRFVDWREAVQFADELAGLLDDIEKLVADPRVGLELAIAFFKLDNAIFERVDDSSGQVSGVFCNEAVDLFVHYAEEYPDKTWLSGVVFDLCLDDNYGVRDHLLDAACLYLETADLRALVERYWPLSAEPAEFGMQKGLLEIESLARQLVDPALLEQAYLAHSKKLHSAACLDLAAVCLKAGQPAAALAWLERPDCRTSNHDFGADKRDDLLLKVYGQLGQTADLEATAWRRFRRHRSPESFQTVIDALGPDKRSALLAAEVALIHAGKEYSAVDLKFLADMTQLDDAAKYVLDQRDTLDGDDYYTLRPLAKTLTKAGYQAAAVALYRSMIEAVLARTQSKYYPYAVRDVNSLRKLEAEMDDWSPLDSHASLMQHLYESHKRKYAFWNQCGNW